MDHRQEIVGCFRIAAFGNGLVVVAALAQSNVAAPIVRNDERARSNSVLDKPTERIAASIWDDRKPDSPGVSAILPLVLGSPRFAVPNFDSTGHEDLVMDAPTFATGSAADVGFISLNMLVGFAADAVLIGTHHASAQLVENAKGCLIARQPELPLKLNGRHSWGMANNQIGRPEPSIQRCMAALHDGANQKAGLPTTCSALQYAGPRSDTKRLHHDAAVWAHKTVSPAGAFQIARASGVIWEKSLEFGKGLRECQIASSMDIHAGHSASGRFRSSTKFHEFPIDTH
jgi:hypothetical protein